MKENGDTYVTVDHLLLALGEDREIIQCFSEGQLSVQGLKDAVRELRAGRKADSENAEETFDALSRYAHDLVADAQSGKLDPVIGRDDEIRRVIQILCRRTKVCGRTWPE